MRERGLGAGQKIKRLEAGSEPGEAEGFGVRRLDAALAFRAMSAGSFKGRFLVSAKPNAIRKRRQAGALQKRFALPQRSGSDPPVTFPGSMTPR